MMTFACSFHYIDHHIILTACTQPGFITVDFYVLVKVFIYKTVGAEQKPGTSRICYVYHVFKASCIFVLSFHSCFQVDLPGMPSVGVHTITMTDRNLQ